MQSLEKVSMMRPRGASVGFALDADAERIPVRRSSRDLTPIPSPANDRGEISLTTHLARTLSKQIGLAKVLRALSRGCRRVSLLTGEGLRSSPRGSDADSIDEFVRAQVPGDVERLDSRAAKVLVEELAGTPVCTVAIGSFNDLGSSHTNMVDLSDGLVDYRNDEGDEPERYAVVLDPLNGTSDADAGASVGTIFAIYRLSSEAGDELLGGSPSQILRKGSRLAAAGYSLYGAATLLVMSTGDGVHGFTLRGARSNPPLGEFKLTRPHIRVPPCGRTYSVNLGHTKYWTPQVAARVDALGRRMSMRYIGSLSADLHRTLLYGGLFLYPASTRRPQGKIRLLFEAAPMAFLFEQAGGAATSHSRRILDLAPSSIRQCVPVCFGSACDVAEFDGGEMAVTPRRKEVCEKGEQNQLMVWVVSARLVELVVLALGGVGSAVCSLLKLLLGLMLGMEVKTENAEERRVRLAWEQTRESVDFYARELLREAPAPAARQRDLAEAAAAGASAPSATPAAAGTAAPTAPVASPAAAPDAPAWDAAVEGDDGSGGLGSSGGRGAT